MDRVQGLSRGKIPGIILSPVFCSSFTASWKGGVNWFWTTNHGGNVMECRLRKALRSPDTPFLERTPVSPILRCILRTLDRKP